MQIIISGKGVDLTDAIENYVSRKINGLDKFSPGIIRATVVVGVETKHHLKGKIFYAECKVEISGNDIFAKKTAKDVYAAIDLLKDQLERELKKHKVKLQNTKKRRQIASRNNKEYRG
ncbi:MAG: ribosome-associated translation inhibitor RaiA [Candidatus Magasanikbacteria bacterium]|nr:ribosome-associated translation inhibitor RaiA [Candidatus Magasanikbacteria bacterium]